MAGRVGGDFGEIEGFTLRTGGAFSSLGTAGSLIVAFLLGGLSMAVAGSNVPGIQGPKLAECLQACEVTGLAVFSDDRCECNPPAPVCR